MAEGAGRAGGLTERLAGSVVALLGLLVALTLFAIMALMVADVAGRYLVNRPIRGAYEITQFLMAIMIFGALPLVSLWRRHVEASLVADLVPGAERPLRLVAGLAAMLTFAVLAILMWRYAGQLARQNAQSLFGAIPHAPFAYFMAVMAGLAALASGIATLRHLPGPGPADPAA